MTEGMCIFYTSTTAALAFCCTLSVLPQHAVQSIMPAAAISSNSYHRARSSQAQRWSLGTAQCLKTGREFAHGMLFWRLLSHKEKWLNKKYSPECATGIIIIKWGIFSFFLIAGVCEAHCVWYPGNLHNHFGGRFHPSLLCQICELLLVLGPRGWICKYLIAESVSYSQEDKNNLGQFGQTLQINLFWMLPVAVWSCWIVGIHSLYITFLGQSAPSQ